MRHPDTLSSPALCRQPPVRPSPPPLAWREADHWLERRRLEQLVRRRFAAEHGARIGHFLPRLFGLWQADSPLAAVGMRAAARGPLFQEHYLDDNAETFLSCRLGQSISRNEIAEIGNLASQRSGLQRPLHLHLVDQLAAEGIAWLLFTATPEVHNGIRRLGLDLHPLMPADPTRLGAGQVEWGCYYDRHPWVMAGDLRRAHRDLVDRGLLPLARPAEVTDARLA
ncbi:MAG: thermostable hemolysin [Halomonas sp.]|uniref:thermostable hemolysin n=1 Tax=Halomonas sp. TaxID=1486246 RepID=UPI00286FF877|nr:thermostable hemolysin [Halomonas sp.]MDR9438138.1 thermostable hemolysin [Halomonas sp.]